ncbi:MAG: VOC family protein [Acidobacteria bacterium]|nr:MAG: VOC family protein [Acidobacteriota bacterium]
MPTPPRTGTIAWTDLTVEDAAGVRDFYKEVVGWRAEPVSMGDYDDFGMVPPGGDAAVAGVCHARGANADIPPQWLIYVVVESVERSAARCAELGGEVVAGPRTLGGGRFAVVRDPAGAVLAIYEPEAER